MKEDINFTHHFKSWPFAAEVPREDGEVNNGAVNLVLHPEKIDLIHEATEENGLRPLLIYLNREDGDFITLGCASGESDDGNYYGYLEFTVRDAYVATYTPWPDSFEALWGRFLLQADSQYPGIKNWILDNCKWEWRYFYLRPETEQRRLVTMFSRAVNEHEFGVLISHIHNFFALLESGKIN